MPKRLLVLVGLVVGTAVPCDWARANEWPLPQGAVSRIVPPLFSGQGSLEALAVSSDGRRLAAAGGGQGLRLWDLVTGGSCVRGENDGCFHCVAFSPDGLTVLGAGGDPRSVVLLEADSGATVLRLHGHRLVVTAVAFSPDGDTLASASKDGSVRLWDRERGRETRTLEGHGGEVRGVVFSGDGKFVVTWGLDETVRLWDLTKGAELRRFEGHRGQVCAAQCHPNQNILATAGMDGTVRLWALDTGKEVRRFQGDEHGVRALSFSSDGKHLACAGNDGGLRLVDVANGHEVMTTKVSEQSVQAIAFSLDNQTVFTADGEGAIRAWDTTRGGWKGTYAQPPAPAKGRGGTVAIGLAPDGRTLITGGNDGALWLWDADTGKPLRLLGRQIAAVCAVAFTPDGKTVLSVGERDGSVHAWDPCTGNELVPFERRHVSGLRCLACSCDGKRIAAGGDWLDPRTCVWDSRGRIVGELPRQRAGVHRLALSTNGTMLAVADEDGNLRTWDVDRIQDLSGEKWEKGRVSDVAWRDDGRLAVWNATSGLRFSAPPSFRGGEFLIESEGFTSGASSRDGRTLATLRDGSVQLWEAATGLSRGEFQTSEGFVQSFCLSANGRRLATADQNGIVVIWNIPTWAGGTVKGLKTEELLALWDDLAMGTGEVGFRATWRLASAPEQSVPWLRERLLGKVLTAEEVERLIGQLDDDAFVIRQRAHGELLSAGEQAESALRAVLESTPSLEMQRRVERLLERLEGNAQRMRQVRIIEVLEHAATPEARELLRELAKGAPEAWLTREAKAVLQRLNPR